MAYSTPVFRGGDVGAALVPITVLPTDYASSRDGVYIYVAAAKKKEDGFFFLFTLLHFIATNSSLSVRIP